MTPAIPLLSMYLKELNHCVEEITYTPTFTAALFTIAKIWSLLSVHQQQMNG